MSNDKDNKRLRVLSEVCLAQTDIIGLQKEFIVLKRKKQRHKMKELAGGMKSSVVMLRYKH
jgi:hypothetical protein